MSATGLRDSFEIEIPNAPVPAEVEGMQQLVYEVHLTNFSRDTLRVRSLHVMDDDRHDRVMNLSGAALADRLRILGSESAVNPEIPTSIAPGQRAIVYIELDCPREKIPHILDHEIEYSEGNNPTPFVVTGGRTAVGSMAPQELGPPVGHGIWVAVHSPDWKRGHRRVIYTLDGRARIPGRFAIDWIEVDEQGHQAKGDPDIVANWFGYGADVLAVADATVTGIRDDVAEKGRISENPKPSMEDAAGNYIALQFSNRQFAFYEHLKPGSIRVKVGDRVHRGQVIAALGFTGESTGPHLHFHVADGPTPLGAEGLPYTFGQFTLLGHYSDIEALGAAKWQPLRDGLSASRADELPSSDAVLQF